MTNKMKTYEVGMTATASGYILVDAESESEARQIAQDQGLSYSDIEEIGESTIDYVYVVGGDDDDDNR